MNEKHYLNAQDYLRDTWRLARIIYDSNWRPTVLLALWRGGAPVGVAVHEFFVWHGVRMKHIAVKCYSYTGIGENKGDVRFESADEVFKSLSKDDRVLVTDDVFDTGKTAAAIRAKLDGMSIENRIACVYYKPAKNITNVRPDYHAKAIGNEWIVFPHEMEGLTREEIQAKDPVLAGLVM